MENLENCPLCDEKTFQEFIQCTDFSISRETFHLVKCTSCGFVFTNPRPATSEIGRYYNSDIYISHHSDKKGLIPWVYRKIRDIQFVNKTNIIKRYFKTSVSVLDIGCGTGDFLKYCNTLGWVTAGVEPDTDAREQANKKHIPVHDLGFLKQTYEKYDVITLWHVLEHVHKLQGRMKELSHLLNDNGIIIIAVPNPNSPDAIHYKNYWAAYDVPRHLLHFTKDSMTLLFKKHNFKLIDIFPMKYDAYYVSIKSEEYKSKNFFLNLINGVINGWHSNYTARKNKEYSSLIYVFKK